MRETNLSWDVLEALPAAVYVTDAEGTITFCNQAAVELAGRKPELGVDRWCVSWRLFRADGSPLPHDECPMAVTLKEGRPVRGVELVAERPDGSRVRLLPHPTPLFDRDGRLTGAVNMLIDATQLYQSHVEAAHLAAIVASSDDAIVSKTLDGVVTSWNAGAERIFGYASSEMVGRSITRIIPPEHQEEEAVILSRLRKGERIDHFETVRVTKDGRRIDVSLTVSPIRDKWGKLIGASKVGRDITERKRAENLQRLLIGELNHRVKNTLAIVQSIANQTMHLARSPGEFISGFSGRLQALAEAHSLLTQGSWQGADLHALVRGQLLLGGTEDRRISVIGPAVRLDPQAALHLALLLHELGTNARKYGPLSVPHGQLSIEWRVRRAETHLLELRWQERGGPTVKAPPEKGFGTFMIERSLQAHGGSAILSYEECGVTCDITLPLPDALGQADPLMAVPVVSRAAPAGSRDGARSLLAGRRVLVVEDEPLVAMDVVAHLTQAGCEVVGPAATLEKAKGLIEAGGFDVAVLDANLGGRPVDELAAAITQRGLPFAFLTGYGRENLPQPFRHAPLISKPYLPGQLLDVIAGLLAQGPNVVPLRHKGS